MFVHTLCAVTPFLPLPPPPPTTTPTTITTSLPGHDFFDTARRVLDFALAENDAGRHFPVMGICLGFETLMILVAGAWVLGLGRGGG